MDINLIRHLANEYEQGRRDPEALMAIACLEAYEQGFDDGVEEAEEQIGRAHV